MKNKFSSFFTYSISVAYYETVLLFLPVPRPTRTSGQSFEDWLSSAAVLAYVTREYSCDSLLMKLSSAVY